MVGKMSVKSSLSEIKDYTYYTRMWVGKKHPGATMINNTLVIIAMLPQTSNCVFSEDAISVLSYTYIHLKQEGMPLWEI